MVQHYHKEGRRNPTFRICMRLYITSMLSIKISKLLTLKLKMRQYEEETIT